MHSHLVEGDHSGRNGHNTSEPEGHISLRFRPASGRESQEALKGRNDRSRRATDDTWDSNSESSIINVRDLGFSTAPSSTEAVEDLSIRGIMSADKLRAHLNLKPEVEASVKRSIREKIKSCLVRNQPHLGVKGRRYLPINELYTILNDESIKALLQEEFPLDQWKDICNNVTIVDFRPLYAVTIHHLQYPLATELAKIGENIVTGEQLESIRDILHKYTNSLRNFEFIHTNCWNTQFVKDIAASRLDNGKGSRLLGALLAEHGLQVGESHRSLFKDLDLLGSFDNDLMRQSNATGQSLGTERTDIVASQERLNQIRVAIRRFSFAIVGGLIIIVPLLILLVGEELPKSLGVISASIVIFAMYVAVFTKLEPENLLAITAAYAAVLVEIIGNKQC
ncbi:hypothetical protein F4678DRAFT_479416 [Xylaria arbuscula]|nr:hypothetical protein F4678DRAFT_479416 [Xylaria arbuscula]